MLRILLLDCTAKLLERLKRQGFNVEIGTAGFATGVRQLPSQLYEKDVVIYDPRYLDGRFAARLDNREIADNTPEFSFNHLQDAITAGATVLVFVNRLTNSPVAENAAYDWIPFMPAISFSKDSLIVCSDFDRYPDSNVEFLAPIVQPDEVIKPVLQKLGQVPVQDYPRDVFPLIWNGRGDVLSMFIRRGSGQLIVVPSFDSNEAVAEKFLHRVAPSLYETNAKQGLIELYESHEERQARERMESCKKGIAELEESLAQANEAIAQAIRNKENILENDPLAKQVLTNYDTARRQPDVALFYLYKAIETVEHKFGSEAETARTLRVEKSLKHLKRAANESYGNMRHAPKPTDVIKKWSYEEIQACFDAAEKVILAFFDTLFCPSP